MKTREEKISELLSGLAFDNGLKIVEVKIIGSSTVVLRILLEKNDMTPVTIDDCAKFSRQGSVLLDVDGIIDGKYILEVSSAGINRPLIKKEDFDRFKGNDVIIRTKVALNNSKKFSGELLGIEDNIIVIKGDGQETKIDFSLVSKANLDIIKGTNLSELRGKDAKNK